MWLFIHRPFEIWPIWGTLHLERIYMILTIICWLVLADKSWVKNRLDAAFLLFAIVLATSWLMSPYGGEGMQTVEDWFKVAIFYVLCVSTVRDERALKQLVSAYLVAVGLYMAHSLWEYHNGRHHWTMGTVRLLGVDMMYGDANAFAATIIYSLPIGLALWSQFEGWWHRGLLAAYAALSAACVLLTSSRAGFVGLCFLAFSVAMLSKRRLTWLLLLALAAPAIWQCLPKDRQARFLTLVDPSYGPANAQESAAARSKGWKDGMRLWKEHRVFGVGPGAFGAAVGTGYESHQLYGQVLGELGTLGTVAFGSILAAFFANALDAYRRFRQQRGHESGFPYAVVWATTFSVVLMLLMGFGGHNLYRYTWLWFGAFQAIALGCMTQQEYEPAFEEDDLDALESCEVVHNDRP